MILITDSLSMVTALLWLYLHLEAAADGEDGGSPSPEGLLRLIYGEERGEFLFFEFPRN